MARKYGMVKCYFEHGLWSANQVKDAVTKGLISSDEYKEITGEDFDIAYLKERAGKNKKNKCIKQYIVDAFTDEIFSGNPSAVCILNHPISDELMQKIAVENRLVETTFVLKRGNSYNLRWFTARGEIDMCGHAVLAAAYVIMNFYEKNKEVLEFDTLDGKIGIIKNDDVFEMDFPQYQLKTIPVTDDMSEAIGAVPREAFLGRDLLLVLENEDTVINLAPDMERLKLLPGLETHVTAKGSRYDCVARSFSPKLGVDEDPVCGIGHCYIAPYWQVKLGQNVLVSRQVSKRGGTVYCKMFKEGRVKLCGKAVLYSEAEIYVD